MTVSRDYYVSGMSCAHCVHAVSEELTALDSVSAVEVDLHPGETSKVTVTSGAPLAEEDVAAAIDEAGYDFAGAA